MPTDDPTYYVEPQLAKAAAKLLLPAARTPSAAAQRNQRKSELNQRLHKPANSTKPKLIPVQKRSKTVGTKRKLGFNLQLPDLKSPTFVEDSLKGIGTLQQFCQQCLGYVQQATSMLDQLQGTAKSLHEAGILQRLVETKGKNLTAGDLTNMLVALMGTPIGGTLLRGMGSKDTPSDELSAGEDPEASTASASAESGVRKLPAAKKRKKPTKKTIRKKTKVQSNKPTLIRKKAVNT